MHLFMRKHFRSGVEVTKNIFFASIFISIQSRINLGINRIIIIKETHTKNNNYQHQSRAFSFIDLFVIQTFDGLLHH